MSAQRVLFTWWCSETALVKANGSGNARVFLQAGAPRSGTTFQFQVMCSAMCLAHGHEAESMVCEFIGSAERLSSSAFRAQERTFLVAKTHGIEAAKEIRSRHNASRLFVTMTSDHSSNDWMKWRASLEQEWNVPVEYVQLYDSLVQQGHGLAYDYGHIFGLNHTQLDDLVVYMRYWGILRRCCGAQMSRDYRTRLIGLRHDITRYVHPFKHHSVSDPEYDMCEAYNLAEIEQLIMNTRIFRECGAKIERLRVASARDLQFDGTYCARAEQATSKYVLDFNDQRYMTLLDPALRDQTEFKPNCTTRARYRRRSLV